ncbi:hypothetical protein ACLOJK_021228 [Asimina triloba]
MQSQAANHHHQQRSDQSTAHSYPLNINGWVSLAAGFLHKSAAHHRSATCPYCPKMFVNPQALGGHLHGHRRERDALRRQCALQKLPHKQHHHQQQQQEKSSHDPSRVRILDLFPAAAAGGCCRDERVLRPDLIHLAAPGLELRLGRAQGEEPLQSLPDAPPPQEFRFGILKDQGGEGGDSSEDTVTCSELKELRKILEEESGDGAESVGGGGPGPAAEEADSMPMELDLSLAL